MANTVPAVPTLCDPLQLSTGRVLRAQQAERLAGLQNWLLSELRADPIVSQSWDGGICAFEDAVGTYARACRWRVPVVSDALTTLRVIIYAGAAVAGAGGNVRLSSAGGSSIVTIPVAAGGAAWYQGTFSSGIVASDYDEIDMLLSALTGDEVIVHSITIQPDPVAALGAALPAALIDGAEPMGITSQGADYPMSAAMAIRMRDAAQALVERPRVYFNWSGLGPALVTYSAGAAAEYLQAVPHTSHLPPNLADQSEFSIHFWTQEQASATVAYLDRWRADVGAGAARVWVQPGAGQTSQRLGSTAGALTVGAREWSQLSAAYQSAIAEFGAARSTAQIASIAAWGR